MTLARHNCHQMNQAEGPYVRFYIQNGVEVATCLASDFRDAMNERDALRAKVMKLTQLANELHAAASEKA